MKLPSCRLVLPGLLLLASSSTFASDGSGSSTDNSMDTLKNYVLNLGQYLGYDLTTSPSQQQTPVSEAILQVTSNAIQQILLPSLQTVFGALPVTTAGIANIASGTEAPSIFVPGNTPYAELNNSANSTFNSSRYSSPSSGLISVSPLIDQPGSGGGGFQNDPVSQAIANILTTPDYSYCLDNAGTSFVECTYPSGIKNENQVMLNIIGAIPDPQTFFSPSYNQPWIAQLNGNSLIAPLMYDTTSSGASNQGSPFVNTGVGISGQQTAAGPLQSQNAAQQAQNFIRYATGSVTPLALPSRNAYNQIYAQTLSKNPLQKWQAQSLLANYLANLRVYAAQASVGVSNLYYILSKRMPQPVIGQQGSSGATSNTTSQALSEYQMATWRLFSPSQNGQQGTPWLSSLNQASAATMQKEIAVLLAEINYQLYLNRQQEERILLTNSMLLLQKVRESQPSGQLTAATPAQTQ
ncbi:hypothetical protein EAW55_00295 [Legionella jordanis]|nr:type IVB secretion system protein IcmX [Legionella jordanis]RMX05141.1 hypothetical protein EAW55_00295 [Legionella jordanis]RMX17397.1 hypothetical protein EAS68_10925 [Legionella jordanis]